MLLKAVSRFHLAAFVVCLILCACQEAIAAGVSFTVRDEVVHKIDPRVFGQFMERPSWGEIGVEGGLIPGTRKLQPGVLKMLEEMEIPIIRFPGGTDVDFMDWRDMVDNVPHRAAERPVSTGHKGHKVTNNFGYDEFLQLCEHLDTEAIIVVNFRDALLKVKSLEDAAAHAASLVAYCNAEVGTKLPKGMYDWPALRAKNGRARPYNAKYFQIGNETWAFVRQLREMQGDAAPKFYARCAGAYIDAMRSVDPSIEIIVDGHDGSMSGIVDEVHRQMGGRISHFATHFYSPWSITKVLKEGREVPAHEIPAADIWHGWVGVGRFDSEGQSILNHPGIEAARRKGYKVSVTEWNWNGWWRLSGTEPALNSAYAKGIGAASYVHAFMRAADVIDIGCQSMLVGNSWGIHAIWADAKNRIPPHYMPTGQVTMLYSNHHGDKLLALDSRNVPTYEQPYRMGGISPKRKVACIDALATADEEHIYFHAVNRSFDKPKEVTIDVSAFGGIDGRAVHHVLEGRLNNAPEPGEPRQIGRISKRDAYFDGKILKVTLPYRSVSCVEFTRR
ncbi:MAG: alpha-L-arabinofuranosidase C-terminal domain-containing protein [Planctomycetota bacterium]|jgi:alpha-N-arabinofuranosidase